MTDDNRPVWNTLIANEHPQGMTTFVGCQIRYLIGSAHGWLGAAGFSASAVRLTARDRWIAWSEEQRRDQLHRVVGLSRFLIRPSVRCQHLASHVLGIILRRLPDDFKSQYDYRPLLVESFTDERYEGTCLRAANFVCVGQTVGRGRQDRHKRFEKTVKTIYMYALTPGWRRALQVPWVDHAPALEPGAGLNTSEWAKNEFGEAPLGDKRLTARLVRSVPLLAQHMGEKINAAPENDLTAINAFYRLVEKPDDSGVTAANILATHRHRSVQRFRNQTTVLAIQDGTDLRFATRPGCEGLQIIGRNQTNSKTAGIQMHTTMAVTDQRLPLGILRLGFDRLTQHSEPSKKGKKTDRWLEGFKDTAQAARQVSGKTQVVAVGDREADFFELFEAQRHHPRVNLLVRAHHNRMIGKKVPKLFDQMSEGSVDRIMEVEIKGLTERLKSSRQPARPARLKRVAQCELRFRQLTLPATIKGVAPIKLSTVHIKEISPPEDEPPVQWHLLTTLEVKDANRAQQVVEYYLQRWRIEDFFRVLKSGCKIEALLFRTAERLRRVIAIQPVIAWRIMVMTLLGRQSPDWNPEIMFTSDELDFLNDYAKIYRLEPPASLGPAVQLMAHLGGFRQRKQDKVPGHQIIWNGYNKLSTSLLAHHVGIQIGIEKGIEIGLKRAAEQGGEPVVQTKLS